MKNKVVCSRKRGQALLPPNILILVFAFLGGKMTRQAAAIPRPMIFQEGDK